MFRTLGVLGLVLAASVGPLQGQTQATLRVKNSGLDPAWVTIAGQRLGVVEPGEAKCFPVNASGTISFVVTTGAARFVNDINPDAAKAWEYTVRITRLRESRIAQLQEPGELPYGAQEGCEPWKTTRV